MSDGGPKDTAVRDAATGGERTGHSVHLDQEVLDRLNEDFADSLLLVGRVIGERPGATSARLLAVDRTGVDATVVDPEGEHPTRIDFAEPVDDASLLTQALLELVSRAREASGDEGTTAGEREAVALSRIRTFLTEVAAVRDVHPHLREITFRGGDLDTFEPAGPDTFLHLLLPPPGRTEVGIDQDFTWDQHARMAPEDQPRGGYYTLRAWRPEVAELDILMVLHGDSGYASAWAGRAQVGDRVALWGPRTAYEPPAETAHLLLVADDTGLPAVAVILEQLPDGVTAHVVAEVGSEDEHQELRAGPGIAVTWLHRDGASPGCTSLLADSVRALPPLPEHTYVWGGGESHAMTAVRRHVRDERGLAREQVSLVAYWRFQAADAAADSAAAETAE